MPCACDGHERHGAGGRRASRCASCALHAHVQHVHVHVHVHVHAHVLDEHLISQRDKRFQRFPVSSPLPPPETEVARKARKAMAAVEEKKGEAKEIEHVNPVPEEMSLPSAAIQRIIKSKLPEGVMIGKEAKVAFSKASSIFILYVTTMCAFRPPPPCVMCPVIIAAPPHLRSSECRATSLTVPRLWQRQRSCQGGKAHDGDGTGCAARPS